jgi:hypothetical protein
VELGYLSAQRAESIWRAFGALEATPGAHMISPGVLEIIAQRRPAVGLIQAGSQRSDNF